MQAISFEGRAYKCSGKYYAAMANGTTTYLHRAIWEKHNGPIPPGYHVHHKDGNPLNNAIENLEALPAAEHMREHGLVAPHLKSPERLALLNSIRGASHEWHKSPDSRAVLSAAAKKQWVDKVPTRYICVVCGTPFESKATTAMYCTRKCGRSRHG